MRKLRLEPDALRVESFDTLSREPDPRGTVDAYEDTRFRTGGCYSCDVILCVETARDTCDNSLDHCTCQCTWQGCPVISNFGSCPCDRDPA